MRRKKIYNYKDSVPFLKAISAPARLKILRVLLKKNLFIKEINNILKLERTLISHHLSTLKKAGLIRTNPDCRSQYQLSPNLRIKENPLIIDFGPFKITFNKIIK